MTNENDQADQNGGTDAENGKDDKARLRWRLARAAIIGLLIGGVVIVFSHLGGH